MTHHLTHTGVMAGRPICGAARAEGDTFTHYMYWNYSAREGVCPDCLAVHDELEAEDAADSDLEGIRLEDEELNPTQKRNLWRDAADHLNDD